MADSEFCTKMCVQCTSGDRTTAILPSNGNVLIFLCSSKYLDSAGAISDGNGQLSLSPGDDFDILVASAADYF
jgi:hypothetical protein